MKSKQKSAAEIAQISVEKLKKYIKETNIADIPKNQFRQASRSPICKKLDITYSTIGSNEGLSKGFVELDKLIGAQPSDVKRRSSDTKMLEARINTLENRVAAFKADNESLRSKLKAYEHFENTLRMPH